ncbi:MAG TPA: hypothetical protein VFY07_06540 [Geomobilimonas sp.]|nr:hypothetical protein [Geomobilimonas sp.]
MAVHEISTEIRSNFHLFCDNFPFPVMLVHKDRTILAVNKAGEAVGYPTGIRCVEMGEKENHKGCLANQALAEQTAKRVVGWFDFAGAVLDSYWIPLAGSSDLFLHFAADITEWAKAEMVPKTCASAGCSTCNCG